MPRNAASRAEVDVAVASDRASKRKQRPVFTFEIALRRDVQQVTIVRVEAHSPKEAIAVAESVADEDTWNVEKCIGVHLPEVKRTAALKSAR